MRLVVRKCSVAFAGTVLVAIGTLGGCSGGSNSGAQGSHGAGHPSLAPTEVASISAFNAKVTFLSVTLNGKTEIGIMETGSAFAKRALVAPLLAKGLTSQEIYLALAPEGATAPPALVGAHADEAAAMSRSAEVRHVTVDTSALLEKDLASCESAIIGTTPPDGSQYYWANTTNSQYSTYNSNCVAYPYNTDGTCDHFTNDWVISGACNESSSVTAYIFLQEAWNPDQWFNCQSTYTIADDVAMAPYTYYYWYWHNFNDAAYSLCVGNGAETPAVDIVQGYELPYLH